MDNKTDFEQLELPPEYWNWRAKHPNHPCLVPPAPGRRVFAVIDGDGRGDGQCIGQLTLVPS